MNGQTTPYTLDELKLESRMGAVGTESRTREIRRIDLGDFDRRKSDIADQLWDAAVEVGFFQLVNHGIDLDEVKEAFATAERFFALPASIKGRSPLVKGCNAGWESLAQVRPSTGTPDQKESYQITLPHMAELWPAEDALPGFRATMLELARHESAVLLRRQARL